MLTDAGQAALRAAAPGHVEGVRRRLFDPLTAEQLTQLREISQAILRRLGEPTRASLAGPDRDG